MPHTRFARFGARSQEAGVQTSLGHRQHVAVAWWLITHQHQQHPIRPKQVRIRLKALMSVDRGIEPLKLGPRCQWPTFRGAGRPWSTLTGNALSAHTGCNESKPDRYSIEMGHWRLAAPVRLAQGKRAHKPSAIDPPVVTLRCAALLSWCQYSWDHFIAPARSTADPTRSRERRSDQDSQ